MMVGVSPYLSEAKMLEKIIGCRQVLPEAIPLGFDYVRVAQHCWYVAPRVEK